MNYNTSDSAITRVARGNDFTLAVQLKRPAAVDGKLTYEDYDLDNATDIAVAIYPTVGAPTSLGFTVEGSTVNVHFIGDIAAGLYGLEVKGKDSLGKDWRWYAAPGEIIEIVEQSSDVYIPSEVITASISVVGSPASTLIEMQQYADEAKKAADTIAETISGITDGYEAADKTLQANIDQEAADRKAADQAIDTSIAAVKKDLTAEAEARTAADATLQTNIDTATASIEDLYTKVGNCVGTVAVGSLNTWPATRADAIKLTLDAAHSRWALVDSVGRNVGLLDIFSDITKCQLTEVLTSHFCKLNDDGTLNTSTHQDGQVSQFVRYYNIAASHLPNEQGTWGAWEELVSQQAQAYRDKVDKLIEQVATLQANEVKMVALTQAEYDALVAAGTVDANTYYNILEE